MTTQTDREDPHPDPSGLGVALSRDAERIIAALYANPTTRAILNHDSCLCRCGPQPN